MLKLEYLYQLREFLFGLLAILLLLGFALKMIKYISTPFIKLFNFLKVGVSVLLEWVCLCLKDFRTYRKEKTKKVKVTESETDKVINFDDIKRKRTIN